MASSLLTAFADAYGLKTADIAKLFDISDNEVREKMNDTPQSDFARIISSARRMGEVKSVWRNNILKEVHAKINASDEELEFAMLTFAKQEDFEEQLLKKYRSIPKTDLIPSVYNAAVLEASIELHKKGISLMPIAYDDDDPHDKKFAFEVSARSKGSAAEQSARNNMQVLDFLTSKLPVFETEEEVNRCASAALGFDWRVGCTIFSAWVDEDSVEDFYLAREAVDRIMSWLNGDGSKYFELMKNSQSDPTVDPDAYSYEFDFVIGMTLKSKTDVTSQVIPEIFRFLMGTHHKIDIHTLGDSDHGEVTCDIDCTFSNKNMI